MTQVNAGDRIPDQWYDHEREVWVINNSYELCPCCRQNRLITPAEQIDNLCTKCYVEESV